jgi:GNAT superfamily N-acetyltransferase
MVQVRKATLEDVQGIVNVCSDGYRATYSNLFPQHHIENIIKNFYNEQRISNEIKHISREWTGWFVAIDDGKIVGAGGGRFINDEAAELLVLCLDPDRKLEAIGARLLGVITCDQINKGAREQWVSVVKGNMMAIPFYVSFGFRYMCRHAAYPVPKKADATSLRYKRYLKARDDQDFVFWNDGINSFYEKLEGYTERAESLWKNLEGWGNELMMTPRERYIYEGYLKNYLDEVSRRESWKESLEEYEKRVINLERREMKLEQKRGKEKNETESTVCTLLTTIEEIEYIAEITGLTERRISELQIAMKKTARSP